MMVEVCWKALATQATNRPNCEVFGEKLSKAVQIAPDQTIVNQELFFGAEVSMFG